MAAKKKLWSRLREDLFLGLLSLAPIVVTVWILFSFIRFLDTALFALLPNSVEPQKIFGIYIPGIGIVVSFFLLLGAGLLARTVTGKFFQGFFNSMIMHVPVVSSLYKVTRQMSTVFFSQESSQAFKQVVRVPFPSGNARTLAFVTGHYSPTESLVFVPTAPNPTSGYVLIYKNEEIEATDLHVDEALKMILSCGAVGRDEPPKNS